MTLISQSVSLSSSPTASSTTASATSTTTAAGATTGAFNQTLTQMMTGGQTGSAGTDANGSPLVMVLPLIANGESAEAPTEPLVETLAPLLQNLEKLDDQVVADPALLAALQSWIQQVQQFLQGNGTNQKADGGETAEATGLTALAANPATLRFALQDALSQLANVAEQASGDQKAKVTQLLQSLQSATAGTGAISDEQWNGVLKAVELADSGDSQVVQPSAQRANGAQTLTAASTNKQVTPQQQASQGETSQQGSEGQRSSTNLLVQSAVKTTVTDEAGTFVDAAEQADPSATDNQTPVITTAGQLSVQTQGTTPSAPVQPVVHVRQFAKEMTEFVVQKLDIVKHTGLTEATIMLRPDHLGQLEVKLTMQNGHLVAQFMTEHSGAKDLLEQQMSQLRTSLQSQGIQVDKVEVTHNESLSSHMYQDGRGSGANQQQQSNQRSKARGREESEDALKVAEMTEELRNWTAEQRADDMNRTGSFTAQA
ncbi:flagellar hook-length control protein FliK [Paenibacillus polymyxa]|uniref:Flagellar hook-length control protein n=1 Tax=Paenibacillus polymyxa TaxID=1406 RepID=A0A378XW54_PAEPO|nr:flagellar hook-length control protein FliK [Paenibacillus polymyxa]MBE7898192.1 flagellar hook-length control protein FliK [Paenibacillus polymyxa]MBG9763369.1 flagellar hook-length control protein [Paenibacillus polymyxa]MCC3258019.1 flagellar hook-length control protein FliK [Paenibacillus polymyxa]QPK55672.1 flagellar hook-length control protein FliK [Paenibacillus polymyxa]QPK60758.1 flagellar hook-length control protein FliK [Paenibacillus polymyxa]